MLRIFVVLLLLGGLAACSSAPQWKGNYGAEERFTTPESLEVPPDLDQPVMSDSTALPTIAAQNSTYSAYSNTAAVGDTVAPEVPEGIKVVRDGNMMWLQINQSTEKLWPQLRVFFNRVGFKITREDKQLGVMETNWLENKANAPTGWLSKLLNRMMSTGLRDKYRARLEKTGKPGVSRLIITHQGMREEAAEDINSIKTWWVRRPSDPELEAEMYQRFLLFRGMKRSDALKLAGASKKTEHARMVKREDMQMLEVPEGFARTWRRVGIALDRIGLLIEDRDRSNGVYYLKITDDFREKIKEEKSWLASLFSSNSVKLKPRYLLSVNEEKGKTYISVLETTGAKANERFVEQLLKDMKLYLD